MSIQLKEHNAEAYQRVKEGFESSSRVAVIHPTGTGKSFIALKFLEENSDKKAIYIAPSNAILHSIKREIFASGMDMTDFPNLDRKTYQKLMNLSSEEIEKLEADIIILDEFHHCGAPEWGSGIDRLIERNPDAQILGLSATPIRYFDKARDMAEEMFGDNIASEMTLEEAISRGILPKAEYVSALYEFEDELARIQSEIEEIKSPEKRQQAQALFDQLSKRIDDDTKNLPNMLSKHMKVKNGKYIIFCKNIEDMQEKMEQAQKMFGDVNPNITTYAVSSKLRENEQTLSDFEQDNDENTLKLMYAVDMLNEGYHINDLDGVVMMRPTYSPTVYTQQLGRALSVRGKGEEAKTPLVIDLVNNFDSIRIIEDLCERLSQYESTGNRPRKDKSESGLIIHDKTKEFRDIAARITELSKRKVVTLEEKIEIFERFFEEGNEEIDGQTVFEGYPIGQWAINIRSYLNTGRDYIKPTEEQLDRLSELGILERRIDSTIDEKIDAVIEWYKNHPDIDIKRIIKDKGIDGVTREKLEKLAQEEGVDFSEIEKQYDRIQRYNEYIRYREFQGKLTEEQRKRCKEGGIGGKFGYTSEIEDLEDRYNIDKETIVEICKKYGSIEEFKNLHRSGKLDEEELIRYNSILINNVIDIYSNPNSKNYVGLVGALMGVPRERIGNISSLNFISSKDIDAILETLSDIEREVIIERFGLDTGKYKTLEEIGEERNCSGSNIRQIEAKALRKLRHPSRAKAIRPFDINSLQISEYITEEEKNELIDIENDIYDSSLFFVHSDNNENEESKEKYIRIKTIKEDIKKREIEAKEQAKKEHIASGTVLEGALELGDLSVRSYNCLKRYGIEIIQDLEKLTFDELAKIRNLGSRGVLEVLKLIETYGLTLLDTTEDRETEELVEKKLTGQDIGQASFDATTSECDEAQQVIESELLNQKKNSIGETN